MKSRRYLTVALIGALASWPYLVPHDAETGSFLYLAALLLASASQLFCGGFVGWWNWRCGLICAASSGSVMSVAMCITGPADLGGRAWLLLLSMAGTLAAWSLGRTVRTVVLLGWL